MAWQSMNERRVWHIQQKYRTAPCIERMRQHVLDNIDTYLKASDFVGPAKRFTMRIAAGRQKIWDVDVVAFLWLRGMPEEMICYEVDLEDPVRRALFVALGMWGKDAVKKSIQHLLPEAPTRYHFLRWLSGEDPIPEEVKEWLAERIK